MSGERDSGMGPEPDEASGAVAGDAESVNAAMEELVATATHLRELLASSEAGMLAAAASLGDSLRRLNHAAAVSLSSIDIPRMLQQVQRKWAASLPGNWRGLGSDELRALAELMDQTGWCLVWVPRIELVRAILRAEDRQAAERCLDQYRAEVVEDLHAILRTVSRPELLDLRGALEQAAAAIMARAPFPAQAMAATVVTTIIHRHLHEEKLSQIGQDWRRTDPEAVPFLLFRRALVLRAVGHSLATYWPARGESIPSRFNRHATAHHLDLTQFTDANALAGLMLAVSFLRELEAVLGGEVPEA